MSATVLPRRPVPAPRATLGSLREHLRAHYGRLGRASRRRRFMAEPSAAGLDRIAARAKPDLLLEVERDGAVRGVFEAHGTGAGRAEVALSVEDGWQGRGLGRELFGAGLRLLAGRGVRTAELFCQGDNAAMLRLARGAGGRVRVSGGEAYAEVDLRRAPGAARVASGQAATPPEAGPAS